MQQLQIAPSIDEMKSANVNPDTGFATDYLNLFNEYIMLAEMVADGSMEKEVLNDWQELDYETHFINTGFSGLEIVLRAYRSLKKEIKQYFEKETNELISLIKKHKNDVFSDLSQIKHQRDILETIIAGATPIKEDECSHAQDDIDALFD